MADRVRVDHAPAPALLSEEPRSNSADDPVLVGAVVDPVRVHGSTVATRYSTSTMLEEGSIDTLFWTKGAACPAYWGIDDRSPE
jgi:hypothetical protein